MKGNSNIAYMFMKEVPEENEPRKEKNIDNARKK